MDAGILAAIGAAVLGGFTVMGAAVRVLWKQTTSHHEEVKAELEHARQRLDAQIKRTDECETDRTRLWQAMSATTGKPVEELKNGH